MIRRLIILLLIVGCEDTENLYDNSIRGYVVNSVGNPVSNAKIIHTGFYSFNSNWEGELMNYSTSVSAFNINITSTNHVLFWIEDVCGDTVNILADRIFSEGEHVILWEADDFNKNKVVSGIYYVNSKISEEIKTSKTMVIPMDLSLLKIINGELGFSQYSWDDQGDIFYKYNYHALTDQNGYFSIPTKCLEFWVENIGLQGAIIFDETEIMGFDDLGNQTQNWTIPYKTKLWIVHEGDSTYSTDWYDVDPINGVEIEIIVPY